MFQAYIHPKVANTKATKDISKGVFLPCLSLRGPKSSCPVAIPMKLNVRLSCTLDAFVAKASVRAGNAGKYKSVV